MHRVPDIARNDVIVEPTPIVVSEALPQPFGHGLMGIVSLKVS